MPTAADLTKAGKLLAPAIDQCPANQLPVLLDAVAEPVQRAALAIIAGRHHLESCSPTLITQLGQDGVAGKAAGWALGQMPTAAVEDTVLKAIADGNLDTRENGYFALAVLAARGVASSNLAPAMVQRVQTEIDRAKSGGSGLGEHACRVLAVLGVKDTDAIIQRVIEGDPYCDRFELQRLRKAVEGGGRDAETAKSLTASWTVIFADHLYQEPAPAPAPAPTPVALAKTAPPRPTPTAGPPPSPTRLGRQPMPAPAEAQFEEAGEPPVPIDWAAFLASPEAQALTEASRQLAAKLGPLLEQFAVQAIQAPLADLSGQEFLALLLQGLPQALPPQHVQMALSPQAINGYQAIFKYFARVGLSTHGEELVAAIKEVRKLMTQQMRQSGMLGGPDYSDPDDKPVKKPLV